MSTAAVSVPPGNSLVLPTLGTPADPAPTRGTAQPLAGRKKARGFNRRTYELLKVAHKDSDRDQHIHAVWLEVRTIEVAAAYVTSEELFAPKARKHIEKYIKDTAKNALRNSQLAKCVDPPACSKLSELMPKFVAQPLIASVLQTDSDPANASADAHAARSLCARLEADHGHCASVLAGPYNEELTKAYTAAFSGAHSDVKISATTQFQTYKVSDSFASHISEVIRVTLGHLNPTERQYVHAPHCDYYFPPLACR